MQHLPLFFDLKNQNVLLIGGGSIAHNKATLLRKAGARLTVVAKKFHADFLGWSKEEQSRFAYKAYDKSDLVGQDGGYRLLVIATNDRDLNAQIHRDAKALGIFVNVVDTPDLCDFIFPAIVDRSPVVVGVSSSGAAPVLARLIRAKIETLLPSTLPALSAQAGRFRQRVKTSLKDTRLRRYFWEGVFTKALDGQRVDDLQGALDAFMANKPDTGEAYIVGAGPGDPDLLTFKALRLMQQADVVLYDALVSEAILDLCRRDSDKIFVGKKRADHAKSQDEINALLLRYAKEGKRVLRLKGGDPLVFGRGGEEALACQKAGVPFEVVSGITAALAAASEAGIALTHRGVATSVRFLTACYKSNAAFDGLKSVYHSDETLVFYMGLHALDRVVESLRRDLPEETPVAIVAHAGLPTRRVLVGDLATIVQKHAADPVASPALIVVGKVVALRFGAD